MMKLLRALFKKKRLKEASASQKEEGPAPVTYEDVTKRGFQFGYQVGQRIGYCFNGKHYMVRRRDRRVWYRGLHLNSHSPM